ncbi:MAG: SsrA-binding protein SmpB [Lentisphaerae bacterium]|nr:SsrA-binding protein SmpB [Lentisphaerota bacterium]
MAKEQKTLSGKLATNRKAFHDYEILERIEAGIELRGTEIKSLRNSSVSLSGSFAKVEEGQAILHNLTIQPYEHGNRFNHPPARPRRLLLHRNEIRKLQTVIEQKRHTIVPLSIYIKKNIAKIELGLCKGKTIGDKRETLKRKTAEREAMRAITQQTRRT